MCHEEHLKIREQLGGAGFFLPTLRVFQGPNLGTWPCAAVQQVSLPLNHLAGLTLYF